MEISFLNNIKKYSSVNDKTGIANVMNEAFREAEKFKNNVNNDLTGLNKVLVREIDVLKRQYEETKVGKTSKDIMTVVSTVQTGDFEARSGIDLTYLLSLEQWEEHYRKNLRFLQEKFGENAKCIYGVIHYDESTPHLHTAWAFSEKNTNEINYKKVENINGAVNKFVAIDPSSQAEMLFERDPKTNKYKVVTYSFVTTGKDGSGSYETPHGAFLIAFTRGYMPFTRKAGPGDTPLSGRPDLTIGGVAKFAVRFSGGGYLHGIPVNTHFKGETALTDTAAKIGTYKESHKCVRHFDDQVGFIVDWVNAGSKIKDGDNTIPEEPVVAIVL